MTIPSAIIGILVLQGFTPVAVTGEFVYGHRETFFNS